MIDADLANLYQVATKTLNQAVKRNLERFPEDLYVPIDAGRGARYKVTNCDLRKRARTACKICALCIH